MSDEPPGLIVRTWSLDEPADAVQTLLGLLNPHERDRAAAFTREEPRRRFIVARARLRETLGECLGVAPAEIPFRYGPKGKPELDLGDGLHFNLSHSAELAVCVVAPEPVGVDLERVRPRRSATDLARRWFHPDEKTRIAAAGDSLVEFYRTWVMKEAALKLVGLGVGEALPKMLTPSAADGGLATGLPSNPLGLSACRVTPLAASEGFVAAVAVAGSTTTQGTPRAQEDSSP